MAYDLIKISALPETTPDESQDIVVGVGNYAKRINYGDVKADMVGTSPSYTTDAEPYLMRQTAHVGVVGKCALEKLVGGSLGWNQLAKELNSTNWVNENGTTASFFANVATFTSTANNNGIVTQYGLSTFANHKYFLCMDVKSSTAYTGLSFGILGSGQPMIRFTDSIGGDAYWHTIEGIRECTSSDNLKRIYIFRTNGTVEDLKVKKVMCLDLTVMFGSTIADYVYGLESATAGAGVAWLRRYIDIDTYHAYDAGSIQSVQATAHVTTGKNQYTQGDTQGAIFDSGSEGTQANRCKTNGYIPVVANQKYTIKTYTSGIYVISYAFYDGDKKFIQTVKPPTDTYTNTFTALSNASYVRFVYWKQNTNFTPDEIGNVQLELGETATPYESPVIHTYPLGSDTLRGVPTLVSNKLAFNGDEKYPDGTIKRKYGSRAYQSGDTSDGATMITDGTTTVYKLATPTTESSTAFQKVQTIDADGTESFTASSPVPVGHETQTPDNVLAALGWLGE